MIIEEHINISTARKDKDRYGNIVDDDNEVSEWALAITLARYKIGEYVDDDEFFDQLGLSVLQQSIDHLIEEGLIEQLWDEKDGTVVFRVTQKGSQRVDNFLDKHTS